jgi:hypothetical protein
MARIAETAAFWLLLTGLWLLTLSSVAGSELVAAVVLALPAAVAAGTARRAVGASWRWPLGWPRRLVAPAVAVLAVAVLVVSVLADTARVLAAVARRPCARGGRGRLARVELAAEASPERAAARRAAAVLVLSLSPGSVVVAATGDELTVHEFAAGRPRLSEVIR